MSILPPEKHGWQWLLSWEVLTIVEPRLLDLERQLLDAMQLPPQEFKSAFARVRQQVAELVGWFSNRRNRVLRSSTAYHIVVAHMLANARRSTQQLSRAAEAEL